MFGLNGYGLFTAACVAAMGVDPAALGMREHSERYDHIGEVRAYVQDHCVHGPGMIVEEILDWRPLDYYTLRLTPFGTIPLDITAELTPVEAGTRVTWRIRLPRGRKAKETWEAMREPTLANFQQGAARMAELLAAEVAGSHDGPGVPPPSPAG